MNWPTVIIRATALSLCLLAGCATGPDATYSTVLEGMTRANLKYNFGEPLRIEPRSGGGEDWYLSLFRLAIPTHRILRHHRRLR